PQSAHRHLQVAHELLQPDAAMLLPRGLHEAILPAERDERTSARLLGRQAHRKVALRFALDVIRHFLRNLTLHGLAGELAAQPLEYVEHAHAAPPQTVDSSTRFTARDSRFHSWRSAANAARPFAVRS